MKSLLIIAALFAFHAPAQAQESGFSDQMHQIYFNFRQAKAESHSETFYPWAAGRVRILRAAAINAIALTPEKVKSYKELERRREMLVFHQTMARLIYMSASLEDAFTAGDEYEATSVSREMDIENLFFEIEKLMNDAHARFR